MKHLCECTALGRRCLSPMTQEDLLCDECRKGSTVMTIRPLPGGQETHVHGVTMMYWEKA